MLKSELISLFIRDGGDDEGIGGDGQGLAARNHTISTTNLSFSYTI